MVIKKNKKGLTSKQMSELYNKLKVFKGKSSAFKEVGVAKRWSMGKYNSKGKRVKNSKYKYSDWDGDGKVNKYDCKPYNKHKQDYTPMEDLSKETRITSVSGSRSDDFNKSIKAAQDEYLSKPSTFKELDNSIKRGDIILNPTKGVSKSKHQLKMDRLSKKHSKVEDDDWSSLEEFDNILKSKKKQYKGAVDTGDFVSLDTLNKDKSPSSSLKTIAKSIVKNKKSNRSIFKPKDITKKKDSSLNITKIKDYRNIQRALAKRSSNKTTLYKTKSSFNNLDSDLKTAKSNYLKKFTDKEKKTKYTDISKELSENPY